MHSRGKHVNTDYIRHIGLSRSENNIAMNTFLTLITLVSGLASAQNVTSSSGPADTSSSEVTTTAAVNTSSIEVTTTATVNATICTDTAVCSTSEPVCTASPCVPLCESCEVSTVVVTALTTYCPEPTVLCTNDACHTLTAPGTLTITDCPCTIATVVTRTGGAAPPRATHTVAAPNGAVTVATVSNPATVVAPSNGAATSVGSLMAIIAAFAASLL